jgi:hypothetical protein
VTARGGICPARREGTPKSSVALAARQKTRDLKARFAAAHRDGMAALKSGDYDALGEAIRREHSIIDEIHVIRPAAVGPHTFPRGGTRQPRKRR